VNRPTPLVSFSQNREDIVLARGFAPWTYSGTWVDIGAGHPKNDSVTHLFSQLGWRGINIEPLKTEFESLKLERPRDFNFNCVVSQKEGIVPFFIAPAYVRGCSTIDPTVAFADQSQGKFEETTVESRRIMSILDEVGLDSVDFLKIDIEGAELEVLSTFDFLQCRPRCIVVEATFPNSTQQNHDEWHGLLVQAGYEFVLFDGINRFYVEHAEDDLRRLLSYPACVLDNYVTRLEFELRKSAQEMALAHSSQSQHLRHVEQQVSEQLTYVASLEEHLAVKTQELQAAQLSLTQGATNQASSEMSDFEEFHASAGVGAATRDFQLESLEEVVELRAFIDTQSERIIALESRNLDLLRIAEARLPGIIRLERIEGSLAFKFALKARRVLRRTVRWKP